MSDGRKDWSMVVKKLIEQGLTISTMESCTGGGIASEITNISGASSVLKESYITYCNDAKIKHGVPAQVIEQFTVYSKETAIEMAKAVKRLTGSDIAIGVTGQLGRIDPENVNSNVNCVWYAIVGKNKKSVIKMVKVPETERASQKKFVINSVLDTLLKFI